MDALCKCKFIIIETIVNIEHEKYTFQRSLLLFLCTEQFTYTNLCKFCRTGQLTFSEHAKCK